MIFPNYFFGRFARHFLVINAGLTLLFVFIEFFEKMMRVSHASLGSIGYYLALSLAPSFFEYIPVSVWLATCMLIKEMSSHNEWDTLSMLGVSKNSVLLYLLVASSCLTLFSFFGKEILVDGMSARMAQYNAEHFKQAAPSAVHNKWFALDEQSYAYVGFADLTSQRVEDLLLVTLDDKGATQSVMSAHQARLNPATQQVSFDKASKLDALSNKQELIEHEAIRLPSLFTQLSLGTHPPTLWELTRTLFLSAGTLTPTLRRTLLSNWLSKILWHLQVLFYPLLTFLFFALGLTSAKVTWLLMLSPYPVTVLMLTFTHYLVEQDAPVAVHLLPYAVLALLIMWLRIARSRIAA